MDVFVMLLKLMAIGALAGLALAVAYPIYAAFDCAVRSLSRNIAYWVGAAVGTLDRKFRRV